MKPSQVNLRPGYQSRQTPHEFHWAEHHMGSPAIVRRLQGDDDVAIVGQGQIQLEYRHLWLLFSRPHPES